MNPDKRDPKMSGWRQYGNRYRAEWTGRGQGVATDGTSWFVTQNDDDPGVSRYSADFSTLEARTDIPRSTAGHVGAVSLLNGTVLVALEGPERVMSFDHDLTEQSLLPIRRPLEVDGKRHLSWVAINPANGLLYTCDWNNAGHLDAYDSTSGQSRDEERITLAESVHRTQGGDFSATGAVYLATDEKLSFGQQIRVWLGRSDDSSPDIAPGIHGFDAATGERLGFVRVPTRPHFPHFEEIEGLGLGPMMVDGELTHVHLSVLDKNHSWVRDDVHLKSFAVPDPGSL